MTDKATTATTATTATATAATTATATAATAAAKNRSPNYPVISLGEAIQRIQAIYKQQRQYPTNRDVLAKLLGYKSLNGASAGLISALSKYGLLEGHGDKLKVSALGQDLSLHRPGDLEYAAAIEKAAFAPALFRDLHNQYPNGLPSEHSVRVELIKSGFNLKSVDSVIRVYRDTLGLLDANNTDSTTDSFFEESMETPTQTLSATGHRQSSSGSAPAMDRTVTTVANDPRMRAIQLPYSVTEWATLQAAFPLSEDAWQQMMAVLTAMKPAIVAAPEKQELQTANAEQSEPTPE